VPLFLLLLAIAVIGGVFAVAVGRIRGGLDEPVSTLPQRPLPERRLTADDVDTVRFSLGFRGYRMDEVDGVLNRLAEALTERDDEIRLLRQRLHAQERASAGDERAEHRAAGS
jgi:DivIVA domain-containing protein